MAETYPLLKRYGIELFSDETGDAVLFVEIFKSAWKQIPLYARRKMLSHWRAGDPLLRKPFNVSVELVENSSILDDCNAIGFCGMCGFRIHFRSVLLTWGREKTIDTIVHELGHAYLYACNEPANEQHWQLSEILDLWGFEQEAEQCAKQAWEEDDVAFQKREVV
jgi:hypothetical protein